MTAILTGPSRGSWPSLNSSFIPPSVFVSTLFVFLCFCFSSSSVYISLRSVFLGVVVQSLISERQKGLSLKDCLSHSFILCSPAKIQQDISSFPRHTGSILPVNCQRYREKAAKWVIDHTAKPVNWHLQNNQKLTLTTWRWSRYWCRFLHPLLKFSCQLFPPHLQQTGAQCPVCFLPRPLSSTPGVQHIKGSFLDSSVVGHSRFHSEVFKFKNL